jgi:hypothetical protein
MKHLPIPGGWYTHALPSGEYASLVADGIVTHLGKIAQPLNDAGQPDGPLFLDITTVGGFHLAGKGANSFITHERLPDGTWLRHGDACGNYSVIYDLQGVLHISDCSIGTQGWRYVALDGTLVTGDQTTGHPAGLSEWTDLGGILLGQGNGPGAIDGGVKVWAGGLLRVLATGACYDIKARRVGDTFALSFYDVARDGLTAHIFWGTVDELVALPPVVVPPPPDPKPDPKPDPSPEPEPVSLQAPNQIEAVRKAMREHPEINTRDERQRGDVLDYVCWALGRGVWGRKSRNPQGTDLNTDGLTFKRSDGLFEIYDVISGTDGSATWEGYGPFRQGENGYWVPARDPVGDIPAPPDPPPPSDDSLEKLRAQVEAMNQAMLIRDEAHSIRYDQLLQRVEALENKPAPVATLPNLRAKGSLRLTLARNQEIDIPVVIVP